MMELAFLLIVLIIAELVMTVWMLARHKSYLSRVKRLERNVCKLAEVMRDYGMDDSPAPAPGIAAPAQASSLGASGLQDLISQATPEDLEQARSILKSLGLDE